MANESDPSPIGLFNYAHSFLGAARALASSDWRSHETHPTSPQEFLYWHSIELFLKAFLLADGVSLERLKSRGFGHDISKLVAESTQRGLRLSEEDLATVGFMESASALIDLRYLEIGPRYVPTFESLDQTCLSIYRSVGEELVKREIPIGFHALELTQMRPVRIDKH
ncbi:MAG: hypothetical protein AAGH74_15865 [Pseudomonadota bacterium]